MRSADWGLPVARQKQVSSPPAVESPNSPLARLASSPVAKRRERPVREPCFSDEGGAGASWIRANADRPFGRVAAAPELAATRRPLRQANRRPLIENLTSVRETCMPVHGRVRACSISTAQQTATTAVGLELGSEDGLDGTIGFDGTRSRGVGHRDDSFSSRAGVQRTIAMATERVRGSAGTHDRSATNTIARRRRAKYPRSHGSRREPCRGSGPANRQIQDALRMDWNARTRVTTTTHRTRLPARRSTARQPSDRRLRTTAQSRGRTVWCSSITAVLPSVTTRRMITEKLVIRAK